jgi:hypothetical protein
LGIMTPWPKETPTSFLEELKTSPRACSKFGCTRVGDKCCAKCKIPGLSFSCRSAYCSKECQQEDWVAVHKNLHKMLTSAKKDSAFDWAPGFPETVVLAFLELRALGKLPALSADGRLAIMFGGARDEGAIHFDNLFSLLRQLVYPELTTLNVCLCGPQAWLPRSPTNSAVTVEVKAQFVEKAFPTAQALSKFQAVVIIAPGFTDNLPEWDPAMRLMLAVPDLPIILTSYSNAHRRDNDVLFDEDVMVKFFRARRLVGTTENCMFYPQPSGALGHKNMAYHIYSNEDDSLGPAPSRADYMRHMTVGYLRYQAECYRSPHFLRMAERLLDGSEPYRESKMSKYVTKANLQAMY